MKPIEDFMREFFKAHVDVELAWLAAYRSFRDRFFVDGYEPFNNAEFRRSCEVEKIVSIEQSSSTAIVTTSTVYWHLQPQLRYTLQVREESWVISKVEAFCNVCDGTGRFPEGRQCSRCKGTGWELLDAQPGTSPNGGPALPTSNSETSEGPPSVS
jgi:hypothetical protein